MAPQRKYKQRASQLTEKIQAAS